MRGVSLCSGIGGLDLAAEMAGIEVVGQVERDPYCVRVLEHHWPDVPRLLDLKEVQGHEFGTFDILFGGIPCQPYSTAGKMAGEADARDLWPDTLRIIQHTRPRWVVIENVRNFVSMALERVSVDMEREGYQVRAFVLPACATGAPHKRERVFVVAHTNRTGRPGQHLRQERSVPRHQQRDNSALYPNWEQLQSKSGSDGALADTAGTRLASGQSTGESKPARPCTNRQAQSRLGQSDDGLPGRLAGHSGWPAPRGAVQHDWEAPRTVTETQPERASRLKALGNAVVPAQAYPIFAALILSDNE